jgi:hypothetical protein
LGRSPHGRPAAGACHRSRANRVAQPLLGWVVVEAGVPDHEVLKRAPALGPMNCGPTAAGKTPSPHATFWSPPKKTYRGRDKPCSRKGPLPGRPAQAATRRPTVRCLIKPGHRRPRARAPARTRGAPCPPSPCQPRSRPVHGQPASLHCGRLLPLRRGGGASGPLTGGARAAPPSRLRVACHRS